MKKNKYLDDLKEIKEIMSRTTQFISLSGLSGVSTGIIALVGMWLAFRTVFNDQDYLVYHAVSLSYEREIYLLAIAIGTIILSVGSAIFFTKRKSKIQKQIIWNGLTKRFLFNLLIPLITGGILCLMLLDKGFIGFLPSLTLIFYGLSLINGGKYTFREIRYLGIIQILLGLLAFQFISYSLLFWTFGFGIIQIIYGLIIHKKN
ncbi:hypothetical protein [uncultured Gelidibacter sp.]|uniref:hypothetical protein n=1 Tax=uncultured Gelidibacter sp. TaxID=259318 RepID=UPI002610FAA0|nr:hypothetical protein [uncultured Gelidibacter sp.]